MSSEGASSYLSSFLSTIDTIRLGVTGLYALIKTANIIYSMNKYVLMSLSFYASYHLLKTFVCKPLLTLSRFLYAQSKPIEKLIINYGKGVCIVTGAARGLGPIYIKKLIESGFRDFILIDESREQLEALVKDLHKHAEMEIRYKEVKELTIQIWELEMS